MDRRGVRTVDRTPPHRRVPRERGRRGDGPQELRGDRFVPGRGPAAVLDYSACGASCCSTRSTTAGSTTWEHQPDLDLAYGAARAHNRGMVEWCSVDHRLLPTCLRAARRLRPGRRQPPRPIELGAAALLVASGCPRGHSRQPRRPRPGVGQAAGGRHPHRVPRRRRRRPDRPRLLPERAARSRPTSTAATRTSARSTTWRSRSRRCRRSPR